MLGILGLIASLYLQDYNLPPVRVYWDYETKQDFAAQKVWGRTTCNKNGCYIVLRGCFKDNNPQHARLTVIHEAAHVAVYQTHGKMLGHGEEWKTVMRKWGLDPLTSKHPNPPPNC